MATRISPEAKRLVIYYFMLDYTLEKIAHDVSRFRTVSYSSVRLIISDLKKGLFPEFEGFLPHLEEIQFLARELRSLDRKPQEVLAGLSIFEALVHLGVEPSVLQQQIVAFERFATPDFPVEHFAKISRQIFEWESKTGLGFLELENRLSELTQLISNLRDQEEKLEGSIDALRLREEKDSREFERNQLERKASLAHQIEETESISRSLKVDLEKRLAHHKLERENLTKYVEIRDRLDAKGVRIEMLGVVEAFVDQLAKYGWNPSEIVSYLQRINSLKELVKAYETRLRIGETQARETKLDQKIASDERNEVRAKLEQELKIEEHLGRRLKETEARIDENRFRLEFVDTLMKLFNDESKIPNEMLIQMARRFEHTVQARKQLRNMPINYDELRRGIVSLIELAIGKVLVTRDFMEERVKVAHESVESMQFERFGKLEVKRRQMEQEWLQMQIERRQFQIERASLTNRSKEELLRTVARRLGKGEILVEICVNCEYTGAYQPGTARFRQHLCPRCGTLLHSLEMPIKAAA